MNAPATPGEALSPAERAAITARAESAFAPSLEMRAKAKAIRERLSRVSTIENDAEVGAFLRERFKTRMTLAQLRAACVERFGAERAPSVGRIGTFRQRVRK